MTLRFSLGKATKALPGSKAKAEEEKNALDKIMADVEDEHSEKGGILGDGERDDDVPENIIVPTSSKRHFTARSRSMKSGPGTLDPVPPASWGRTGQQTSAFLAQSQAANEYAGVIAKASNLPPGINPRLIEDLFADYGSLKIVKTEKLPPDRPNSPAHSSRPSATLKITFDKHADSQDLNIAIGNLHGKKYLGRGYYLHLDRYRPSNIMSTKKQEEPFAATLREVGIAYPEGRSRGHGMGHKHGPNMNKQLVVTVHAPPDAAMLRLIHQTVEGVVQGGLEFEAALMQVPQVQEEERFAWLFDQRHPLNRFYRWRLFQIVNGSLDEQVVFDQQPPWHTPDDGFVDEYAHELKNLGRGNKYWDQNEDDNPMRRAVAHGDVYPGRPSASYGILCPRSRALLIWMLSSFPGNGLLNFEVASICDFAIKHATNGLDEVVDYLITNIFQPFSLSAANRRKPSSAPLVPRIENALNIVSDVLLTSYKQSGHAVRYRQVIGEQLVARKVFEYLETIPNREKMQLWGRTNFRKHVNSVLDVWKHEHIVDKAILKHMDDAFNERERQKLDAVKEQKAAERRAKKMRQKAQENLEYFKKHPLGLDGAMDEEEDEVTSADASENESEDVEEVEAVAAGAGSETIQDDGAGIGEVDDNTAVEMPGESAAARARRLRPKAEDMFISDGE
ncbi:hypothetical protein DM02DRAFT_610056 [Periconia macrospinosa]|uniref:SURP motif domain-containing protein n=1 Tax=Periconia macrospinosa TaxID=97972 RepID=A0A2V1E7H5_9PLEO|nr:hypothetical protein DM02DRAFT_610056 [Periconia macrospinosa]